jgi:hypothetical protein
MGQKLKISFSNRPKLKLNKKKNSQSKKYNEIKKIIKNEQRYQKFDNILIPLPSDSLFVFGIPVNLKETISHESVFTMMRDLKFKPKKIFLLKGHKRDLIIKQFKKNRKIKNLDKSIISIYKYNNISEAMSIIAHAHAMKNKQIYLNISFSYFRC